MDLPLNSVLFSDFYEKTNLQKLETDSKLLDESFALALHSNLNDLNKGESSKQPIEYYDDDEYLALALHSNLNDLNKGESSKQPIKYYDDEYLALALHNSLNDTDKGKSSKQPIEYYDDDDEYLALALHNSLNDTEINSVKRKESEIKTHCGDAAAKRLEEYKLKNKPIRRK
jgi:hypothetical protein